MLVLLNGKHNAVLGLIIEVFMWSIDQRGDKEMSSNILDWLGDDV